MFCRYCGQPLPDDTIFCSSCGKDQRCNPNTGQANAAGFNSQPNPQPAPQPMPQTAPQPAPQPNAQPKVNYGGRANDPKSYPVLYSARASEKLSKKLTRSLVFSILSFVLELAVAIIYFLNRQWYMKSLGFVFLYCRLFRLVYLFC